MTTRIVTDALLVQKRERGEADLLVWFYTREHGALATIAYSARRSKKRFAVLEPFHTLRVEVDDSGKDVSVLREAVIAEARPAYLTSLSRIQAASTALGWVRTTCPPRAPDAAVWEAITRYLDAGLACGEDAVADELAAFGLNLLRAVGLAPPPSSVRSGMSAAQVLRVVAETIKAHAQ